MSKLTAAAANIRNTYNGGLRTGLSAMRNTAPGPVTVWCGPGPTSLPHTLDGIAPVKHPEPSNVDPSLAKVQAARAAAEARTLKATRQRNQRAAQRAARAAAQPAKAPAKRKPITIAATRFDNSRYERSHRKQPRGRGFWLFERKVGDVVFQHNGTLAEAKTAATKWAREQGYGTTATGCLLLYVCP